MSSQLTIDRVLMGDRIWEKIVEGGRAVVLRVVVRATSSFALLFSSAVQLCSILLHRNNESRQKVPFAVTALSHNTQQCGDCLEP